MNMLDIGFIWQTVRTDVSTSYEYPKQPSPFMRTEYSRPGVYRWALCLPDGRVEPLYVGETEKLHRRLRAYLKPRSKTEQRVKQELDKAREQGLSIRFEVLEFEPFEINGIEFQPRFLTNPFARKAIENLVVLSYAEAGFRVSNQGRDVLEKILAPLDQIDRLKPSAVVRELKGLSSVKSTCK
jgi:hypothetical protein